MAGVPHMKSMILNQIRLDEQVPDLDDDTL
jgi:hypothetical protein